MNHIVLVLLAVSGLFGLGTGAFVTYKVMDHSRLKAEIAALKKVTERYEQATGVSVKIDEDFNVEETTNEKIVQTILSRAPAPSGADPTCIDAISMQDIRSLK